ncbi:MAG: hypothetical protein EP343_08780 [Deltaproteobacteria bacterium]|nr:MAG: hypothetical protein EP343_08780 [Deltaproteobacteria bacterium]
MFQNVPRFFLLFAAVLLLLGGNGKGERSTFAASTSANRCKETTPKAAPKGLEGLEIRCWNSHQRRSRREWKQGKPEGRWEFYHSKGHLLLLGHFKGGKRHGKFKSWYSNGQRKGTGQYNWDAAEGEFQGWWPNGKLQYRGAWKHDKQEGTWYHWRSSGQRWVIAEWADGDTNGTWLEWWPNGRSKALFQFRKGKQHGESRLWWPSGKPRALSMMKKNKKVGTWMHWFRNGQLARIQSWHRNKKHGPWLTFYQDGRPQSRRFFQKGKREGLWLFWHPNGQRKAEYKFRDDSQSGPSKSWYANGSLESKGPWMSHVPHGTFHRWSNDHKTRWEETWSVGSPQSPWKTWHNNKTRTFPPTSRPKPKKPSTRRASLPATPTTWKPTPGPQAVEKLRLLLRKNASRMAKAGYPLYESYCHVGAAFSSSKLHDMGVEAQLFQPIPFHMLTYFDAGGQRYYVDQTMAQFFKKGTNGRNLLLKMGGFVGTPSEFHRFYRVFANDALSWDMYQNTGYLKPEDSLESQDVLPYNRYKRHALGLLNYRKLNSQETRGKRIADSWYQDFQTETSYNQATGLYWTAMYFYTLFHRVGQLEFEPFFDNKRWEDIQQGLSK